MPRYHGGGTPIVRPRPNRINQGAVTASYEAEAVTYFAAMSVQPDATRKGQLNTLIASLKSAGVWTKLDALYVMAAHDAQAARINAVTPASVAAVTGMMTFTANQGYAGDGTTGFMDTGWNATTAGSPKFTQSDAHMGVWARTAVNSGYDLGVSLYALMATNYFGTARYYPNANSAQAIPSGGVGHFMSTRRSSTAIEGYKDGVSGHTASVGSTALINANFLISASNSSTTGTITAANFSSNQLMFAHWGSQLSAGEVTALYNALNTYKTAVGA